MLASPILPQKRVLQQSLGIARPSNIGRVSSIVNITHPHLGTLTTMSLSSNIEAS